MRESYGPTRWWGPALSALGLALIFAVTVDGAHDVYMALIGALIAVNVWMAVDIYLARRTR